MKHFKFIAILCLLSRICQGQTVRGHVRDAEHFQPIGSVTVMNKNTATVALTHTDGSFSISAVPGQVLMFSHMSFEPNSVIVSADNVSGISVRLVPNEFMLQKVIISSRTKYQKDSAERHEMFGHELARPLVPKPKYLGLGCAGCFGWLADKITGNSKKAKRFRKGFAGDDEIKFIDSRYNSEVVALLIDMKDPDSIAMFINHYPMEYDFARAATELELKAWIRANYREYRQSK